MILDDWISSFDQFEHKFIQVGVPSSFVLDLEYSRISGKGGKSQWVIENSYSISIWADLSHPFFFINKYKLVHRLCENKNRHLRC